MTSKTLASLIGLRYETIARRTKKAIEAGQHTLSFDGIVYVIEVVHSARGKSYEYHEQTIVKKKALRSTTLSILELKKLKDFDISKSKYTQEDKVLMIAFYQAHSYGLRAIIKALATVQAVYLQDKDIASLERKIRRWLSDFKAKGKKALEDKRGAKSGFSKIDEELLTEAILGAGSRGIRENYYGVHRFYTYLVQQEQGTIDTILTPSEIIAYSSITRGIQKLFKQNHQLKMFWKKGKDGLLQDYVSGIKDISYINEEWQVDATKFDFMCISLDEEGKEKISRLNLTAVIDVYSGNAVASLVPKIDSYAQIRVLQKAFKRMGKPEQIYTDNGMDYVSEHYQSVLEDIGVTQIKAQVGQGRQKGKIERFFGVVQTELANLAGYIGNNVAKRTRIEDQTASKIDIRTSKATRINPARLLRAEELQTIIDNILAKANADYTEQKEFMLTSIELEDLRQKMGKHELRTVQTDGVRLNNYTYTSVALWTKGLNVGHKVEVYEDIDNINQVYVYKDEAFIGIALNRELGVEAMTLEEFKLSKKAYKANHVAPIIKKIASSKKLYEQYEDHNAHKHLEYVPEYAKPIEIEEKKEEAKVSNNFMDFIIEQQQA